MNLLKQHQNNKIKFSIFSRMLAALFFLLVSTLMILTVSLLQNAANQFDDFRLKHAQSLAHTLAEDSLDALVTEDYELLERFVKSSLPSHYGAYAYITRPNGQILSSTDIGLIAIKIIPPQMMATQRTRSLTYNNRPVIEVINKASIGEKHLANVHIAYYTDQGNFSYLDQAKDIIIALTILLIVILAGTYIIVSRIRNPVLNLINTIVNISYNSPIHLPQKLYSRKDEIGLLARTFDDVFTRLFSANKKAQEAKDNLEIRVEKRTQQLADKNNELDAEKKRINTIMDNAGDSIITINEKGIIESFNIAAQKLFGYDLTEIKGKNVKQLMPESFHAQHTQAFEKYINANFPYPLSSNIREVTGKRKDGSEFPIELKLNHINLHGDNLFIGIVRDITLQKHAKENLLRSNELLESKVKERTLELNKINKELVVARDAALDASKIKSEFLSTISHELRTPLHAITGYENILSTTNLTDKQTKYCKHINVGAQKLLEIINEILDFSAFESGELKIESNTFSIAKIIKDICRMFMQSAKNKGLKLSYHIDKSVPDSIYSDATRLRQIIVNLVSNAVKFTEQGEITVTAKLAKKPDKKSQNHIQQLLIEVKDTGIGIEETQLERIFSPFYQVDGSVTRSYGGTGLGLAMSSKIIELMGGKISVQSHSGQDSTFTISLPLFSENNNDTKEKVAPLTVINSDSNVSNDFNSNNSESDKKIIIVEDNEINAELLTIMLNEIGYNAEIAENGSVFLDKMAKNKYDLVLMDCQMPILNGYDATQQYRQSETDNTHIPIIAVTANAMAGDKTKCLASGMDDYIQKPVKSKVLKQTVNYWLNMPKKNISS